jgi:hypothetical protein
MAAGIPGSGPAQPALAPYRLSRAQLGFVVFVKNVRPVAQLAEQRSPKPQVGGSIPSWPATFRSRRWRCGEGHAQKGALER